MRNEKENGGGKLQKFVILISITKIRRITFSELVRMKNISYLKNL